MRQHQVSIRLPGQPSNDSLCGGDLLLHEKNGSAYMIVDTGLPASGYILVNLSSGGYWCRMQTIAEIEGLVTTKVFTRISRGTAITITV